MQIFDQLTSQPTWQNIEHELLRMRQAWSCPRDLRPLGDPDFNLRPILSDVIRRYTHGQCLDFAVRLASENSKFKLAGFYAGFSLIHAFVMDDNRSCIEVSGVWTLSEMKKLHASDGKFELKQPALEDVLNDIAKDEQRGVAFDSTTVVMTVAGCLPHLHSYVPSEFVMTSPDEALQTLTHLKETGYAMPERSLLPTL